MSGKKLIILSVVFGFTISGCNNSSSGSSAARVSATSSEASSMLNSVSQLPKIGDFVEYVETQDSDSTLTAAQKELLKFCQKTTASTGDPSNYTSEIEVAGLGCPISYSLDSQASKIGGQYSAEVNINYQVLNSDFASQVEIQSANCNISLTGTETEFLNLTGSINCQIVSKTHGAIAVAVTLQLENSLNSHVVAVNATIASGVKSAHVSILVKSISGVKTTEILINGEPASDTSDLAGLTDLLAM